MVVSMLDIFIFRFLNGTASSRESVSRVTLDFETLTILGLLIRRLGSKDT